MGYKKTFSSPAAGVLLMASLAMMSTAALGACKTTLRGELVQAPPAPVLRRAYPGKFLFFSLTERTPGNPAGSHQQFQSFVVPNASATLPIPFVLDIDSPKDCPSEVELHVTTEDSDQPPGFRFASYEPALRGSKTISLDKFEIVSVWGPYF